MHLRSGQVWFHVLARSKFAQLHIPTSSPATAPLQFGAVFVYTSDGKWNGGGLNSRRAPGLAQQRTAWGDSFVQVCCLHPIMQSPLFQKNVSGFVSTLPSCACWVDRVVQRHVCFFVCIPLMQLFVQILVIKIEVTSMSSKIRGNRNFIGVTQCKDAADHLPHGLFLLGDCAEFSFVLLQLDG